MMRIERNQPPSYPAPEYINLVLDHRKVVEEFHRLTQAVNRAGRNFDLAALRSQLEAADKALRELVLRPSKPASGI
jgi:hypothetical protein